METMDGGRRDSFIAFGYGSFRLRNGDCGESGVDALSETLGLHLSKVMLASPDDIFELLEWKQSKFSRQTEKGLKKTQKRKMHAHSDGQ